MLGSREMIVIRIPLATENCQCLPHRRLKRSSLIAMVVAEDVIRDKELVSLKVKHAVAKLKIRH